MGNIVMDNYGQPSKGRSQWWLGTKNKGPATFPSNERLKELFEKHKPISATGAGELTVLNRSTNHCLIEIPSGSTAKGRAPFVEAVEEESQIR
jgi:hypothetical protein